MACCTGAITGTLRVFRPLPTIVKTSRPPTGASEHVIAKASEMRRPAP